MNGLQALGLRLHTQDMDLETLVIPLHPISKQWKQLPLVYNVPYIYILLIAVD